MYQLLETIRLEAKKFCNLDLHAKRMRESRAKLFGVDKPIPLASYLEVPSGFGESRYKCSLPYGRSIGTAEYSPYTPIPITKLVVVNSAPFDYSLKWIDRSALDALKTRGHTILQNRSGVSGPDGGVVRGSFEIIISIEGRITDTSYSNIAFRDGERWVTPAQPLLEGTKRRELLDSGVLREKAITVDEMSSYGSVTLINSMLDPGEIEIPTQYIAYDPEIDP